MWAEMEGCIWSAATGCLWSRQDIPTEFPAFVSCILPAHSTCVALWGNKCYKQGTEIYEYLSKK
jgi:hypothetical protein